MSKQILIYISELNPRIEYVFKLIFRDLLNFTTIEYSSDPVGFIKAASEIKFSYGTFFSQDILFFAKETNILFQTDIEAARPSIVNHDIYPLAFTSLDKRSILPFDFPAFAFYLTTRYEEYQKFQCDKHLRFSASESLAYQEGFLELPLIDLWGQELYLRMSKYYSKDKLPARALFSFQPSYDIDYAWAYLNKGWGRTLGAIFKNVLEGKFKELKNRLKVFSGRKKDPYYTFDYLDSLAQEYPEFKPIFFFLLGNYAKFDKNSSHRNNALRALIRKISASYQIGIHPSYASNTDISRLIEELTRLQSIVDGPINCSRQHFLKLQFPETYQRLIKAGIRQDYTMGYANTIGFRASIARSFNWYDLSTESETELRIHPFMFMDVTLKDYMKLPADKVLDVLRPMIKMSKTVGAELICIWHNNSFSEQDGWEGWRAVYESILREIASTDAKME